MKLRRLLGAFLMSLVTLALSPAKPIASAQEPSEKGAPASSSTTASPESLGFSSPRLERLHVAMQQEIDQKKTMAGAVTLLARHGKLVDLKAYGKKDLATGTPMTTDTIFRVFSMTKVVTGVSMMILYEQGKWNPQDPISKYIPEFAHLKVFRASTQTEK
jgi:CubicO group peptidase (beta-lactamase class C family)